MSEMTTSWVDAEDGLSEDQSTLGEWLDRWLALCSVRGLRQTTVEGYRRVLELYVPGALRETALGELRPQHLNALYAELLTSGRHYGTGGLSARTVRYVHASLNKALGDAVRLGMIDRNAAQVADPPSRSASQARIFPTWTPEELRRFLSSAKDDPWYPALHLAATTGLRRGELLGLRWGDLDLDSGELQVVQCVVQVGWEPVVTAPKTRSSRRRIALDRTTVEVLRAHRRVAEASALSGIETSSLVFPGRAGAPQNPNLFSGRFQRLVKKSGLRRIRFHDLRHGHATNALRCGISPKVVAERLGHSSVVVTLDLYSHAVPSLQREAAEIVASLIGGTGT
jgi:integrase